MSAVLHALDRWAAVDPDRQALVGLDRAWTYAELRDEVASTARALDAAFADGDPDRPVALLLDNRPAWVVADLALMRLGRPALPLPGFFTADQRAHALKDSGAAWLLHGQPGEVEIAGTPLSLQATGAAPVRLPTETAKITYTSGSTGAPKGVCLSLDQMEATG